MVSDELNTALDTVVAELLAAAGVTEPPVDALQLARELTLTVAYDARQSGRARIVQLAPQTFAPATILLRPEPRAERRQWAVAHELGETCTARLFELLDLDPQAMPGRRETFANLLAGRLLLPTPWFAPAATEYFWNLRELKTIFATASHELIARRMLDLEPPIVVTVFDQGQITWRKTNVPGRLPPLSKLEQNCQQTAARTGHDADGSDTNWDVTAWAIHEANWRREILRAELRYVE